MKSLRHLNKYSGIKIILLKIRIQKYYLSLQMYRLNSDRYFMIVVHDVEQSITL